MNNGSGVSRADRNRNARLTRLREAVPLSNAIVAPGLVWDPAVATHGSRRTPVEARIAALPASTREASTNPQELGRGEPSAALRTPGYLDFHHGQPRPPRS